MKNIKEDLKLSGADYSHLAIKTVISSVPYLGGSLSEIYSLILGEPISKRRDEWLIMLYEAVEKIEERVEKFDINTLKDNEQFITIVLKASQIVIRDHALEKKKALINACINTAMNISTDDNEQMMFLNYVDELTVWHLKVLGYFADPKKKLQEKSIDITKYAGGSPSVPFFEYYNELIEKQEFTRIIVKDLHSRSLFNTDNLGGFQSAQGMLAPKLTDFGRRFMSYISEDNE